MRDRRATSNSAREAAVRWRLAGMTALAAVVATACGVTSLPSPRSSALPKTSAAPNTTTPTLQQTGDLLAGLTVSDADEQAVAEGGNGLTVDMLKQLELTNPGGNFVDSAYSLATALAMLQLGARGNTAAQIASVLHSSGASAAQQAADWKQFDATLLATASADGIALDVANALWLAQGLPVNGAFLDTLVQDFSAPSTQVDFSGDPQGAADLINHWVSNATHGMIPTVVTASDVQPAKFVLADALYLNAKWKTQFIANNTSTGPFHRSDGSVVSADLMHSDLWTLPVYIGATMTAVEMPYVGGHFAADVIMPTSGSISDFTAGLSPDSLASIDQSLVTTNDVALTLPKFDIASSLDLKPILSALGMGDAFKLSTADLSGVDGRHDLYIGFAKQQAHVQVDEIGTTATAATLLQGLGGASGPVQITHVVIDHPFLFIIRDLTSGAIIFTAQVNDPTASS